MASKTSQHIVPKICCVIAAFCLWLYIYNWENPIKTYKISDVPVELINTDALTQSRLCVSPGQTLKITLNIRGGVSDTLRLKADDFKIVADMSAYAVKKGENRIPVQIVHYPVNVNVLNGDNMLVDVNLDTLSEKTMPKKIKVEGHPKEGYHALEPEDTDNNVEISGADQNVKKVKSVVASANIDNLDTDFQMSVPLQAVDESGKVVNDIKIKPESTQVIVPIKRVKSVKINVKTVGTISSTLNLKNVTPMQTVVDLIGTTSALEKIDSVDTEPIDLGKITASKVISANLILPSGVGTLNAAGSIDVRIEIGNIINKNVSVPIVVKNLSNTLNAVISSSNVSVVVSGDEAYINNLKSSDISCYVDLNSFQEGTYTLPVNLTLPDNIKKVSISPESVNATITKKQ